MKKLLVAGVTAIAIAIGITASQLTTGEGTQTGSITRSYAAGTCDTKSFCWTCKGSVALDSVTVNVETNVARVDAVKMDGCTGTIGSLTIVTNSADGVKVAEATHDLIVNGGSILCSDKVPDIHQDGIQVMGGTNLTFRNMRIDCGRAGVSLIDSNVFVNESGQSTHPPSAVIFANDWLGPNTAHTVNLQTSVRSGVRSSTICPGKFPRLTFTKGAGAVNSVDRNNTFPSAC